MSLSALERVLYDSLHENSELLLTTGFENKHDDDRVYTPYTNVLPVGETVFTPRHPVSNVSLAWDTMYHVRLHPHQTCYDANELNTVLYQSRFAETADGYHPSFEEVNEGAESTWIEFPFVWYDVDGEEADSLVKITVYPDTPSSKYSMQRGLATAKA